MREIVNRIYQNIQNLQIQPSEHNVMLIADSLMRLKDLFSQLPEETPKAENKDAEAESDGEEKAG